MPHQPSLSADDLDALIRSSYPYPLARAWGRARAGGSGEDTSAQLKAWLECFEVTLRFVLAVQLADALQAPGVTTARVSTALREAHRSILTKTEEGGGTEGGYAHALDLLNLALSKRGAARFVPCLDAWQKQPRAREQEISAAVSRAKNLRNDWSHHRTGSGEQRLRDDNRQLRQDLRTLFEALRPLANYQLCALRGPPVFRGSYHQGRFALLAGEGSVPRTLETACAPGLYSDGEVYLLHPDGQALLLSPFAALPDRLQSDSFALLSHFVEAPDGAVVALRSALAPDQVQRHELNSPWPIWTREHGPLHRCTALHAKEAAPRPTTAQEPAIEEVPVVGAKHRPLPRQRSSFVRRGALAVGALLLLLIALVVAGLAFYHQELRQSARQTLGAVIRQTLNSPSRTTPPAVAAAPVVAAPVAAAPVAAAPVAAAPRQTAAPRAAPAGTALPAVTLKRPKKPAPQRFTLSAISAGTFTQGSPEDEPGRDQRFRDEVQREVTITRPFWMQTTEVTVAQWQAVMGSDPSFFTCGPDCPVELVSWFDALAFLNSASLQDGLTPCYTLEGTSGMPGGGCPGTGHCKDGFLAGEVRYSGPDCDGYRLPTEAEWEYAARAGTGAARYGHVDALAWTQENVTHSCTARGPRELNRQRGDEEQGCKHPVRQKEPNAWGLYDMLGNVAEWTWDADLPRSASSSQDPQYDFGGVRVFKGGSWVSGIEESRAAARNNANPQYRSRAVGLRVARSMPAALADGNAEQPLTLEIDGQTTHLAAWPTEVTQAEWVAVMGANPARFTGCGPDCPVERVSWYDALTFLNRLSAQRGLPACYALEGCAGDSADLPCLQGEGWCDTPRRCAAVALTSPGCAGYRLPTEAERRAIASRATGAAWGQSNTSAPRPVGQLAPSQAGLYDLGGNVWEWVWSDASLGAPGRVCGCGWMDPPERCDAQTCQDYPRRRGGQDVGLRPVRTLAP